MRIQRAFLLVLAAASQAVAYFPDIRQMINPRGNFDCLDLTSGAVLECAGRSGFFNCGPIKIPNACAVLEEPDDFAKISAAREKAGIAFRVKANCAKELMCKLR